MADYFPYLKLCDHNWKASQIATEQAALARHEVTGVQFMKNKLIEIESCICVKNFRFSPH